MGTKTRRTDQRDQMVTRRKDQRSPKVMTPKTGTGPKTKIRRTDQRDQMVRRRADQRSQMVALMPQLPNLKPRRVARREETRMAPVKRMAKKETSQTEKARDPRATREPRRSESNFPQNTL